QRRESRHLGGRAPFENHVDGLGLFQPAEVLRQKRRTHAAESIAAVTGCAVLVVKTTRLVGLRQRGHDQRCACEQQALHREQLPALATTPRQRLHGVTCTRGGMSATPISSSSR